MKKLTTCLFKINVSRHLANHLAGREHTDRHRKIFGAFIMLFGVGVVKASMYIDVHIVHFLGDVVGFAIHGVGLIPFIHQMEDEKNIASTLNEQS